MISLQNVFVRHSKKQVFKDPQLLWLHSSTFDTGVMESHRMLQEIGSWECLFPNKTNYSSYAIG